MLTESIASFGGVLKSARQYSSSIYLYIMRAMDAEVVALQLDRVFGHYEADSLALRRVCVESLTAPSEVIC